MSPAPAKMNPFPGLRPFTQEEDYLFFGREEQTIELLKRLGGNRFVAVVGTSGSGKSSLVRCGLLSQLLGGKMLGAGAAWEIAVTHPGGNPLAILTDALLEAGLYNREQTQARENLLATLSRSHFGLVEAVKQADLAGDTNFLLVVDQFEEIFRFHEGGQVQQEAANEFVSLLLEAVAQTDVPIYVVLTMRSDFIGECGQFDGLAEMVNRGEFLIPRLTREQYKRVIEGPIRVAGGQIAPRLLQRLLNDLGQQADQLPCLQHALMRTWDVWTAKGDSEALDLDDYHCVGRMSQALSLHADEIYQSLADDRQRALCQGIFQALTVEESNNRGIRRPQRLGRLCQILDVSADELRPIIDAYRQSGVTFLIPSPEVALTDQTIIDISHESLMRVWTRLRQWVEEETQAAGIYHRLSESAALHADGKAGLYRDPELGIALAWREIKRPNAAWAERYRPGFDKAIGFLEVSREAAEREEHEREIALQRELEHARQLAETQARFARLFRRFAIGLAVGLCVAVVLTAWAFQLRHEAKRQEATADEQRQIAQGKERESDHERILAQNAERETKRIATQANADKEVAQRENYRSTIKLAESMLQGDVQAKYRVADILWAAQPELRGWEWGHLMARCPLEEWSLQTSQNGLDVLTASADGRFLATAGRDGTVALWDAWTRKELWRQKTGRSLKLAIDPRNRYVGISSAEESQPCFRIFDIATGRIVHKSDDIGAAQITFSPDGKDAYVLRPEKLVRIGTKTWARLASTPRPRPQFFWSLSLFVDLDGAYVGVHTSQNEAPSGTSRRSALFDAQTLQPMTDLDAIIPNYASNVGSMSKPVLQSDTGRFVYSDGPNLFRNALASDGSFRKSRPQIDHSTVIDHLAFDARSETTIVASKDGSVTIRDADGQIQTMSHGLPINGLALLSDGRFITGGADGLLKCWKPIQTTQLAVNTDVSPSPASDGIMAFANSGASLLYRTWETNRHFMYDTRLLSYQDFSPPERRAYGRYFPLIRPGTNELVTDRDTGLDFYNHSRNGTGFTKTRSIKVANPFAAAFDASGRILVVSTQAGEPAVFDVDSQRQLPAPEARGFGHVSINPAGTRAALLTGADLQVWDVATGRLLNRFDLSMSTFTATDKNGDRSNIRGESVNLRPPAFHPNGDLLAFIRESENSSSLVVLDTKHGKIQASIPGEPGRRITACQFSSDGNRIFTACSDAKVRIWDWRIGKELLSLSDAAQTNHVAAHPDGLTIAYSGWSPSLRIAKSLPWNKLTQRDGDFYHAVDDLWTYTARLSPTWKVPPSPRGVPASPVFAKPDKALLADEAETLGDIQRHRGQPAKAIEHYSQAIEIRQKLALADPGKAQLQYRLAAVYEKDLAVESANDPTKYAAILLQATDFWQKLTAKEDAHPHCWRWLVDFRSRYSVAVAASFAAARQGKNQPPLDEAAQVKLRRRTIDALKVELTAWGKVLQSGPQEARSVIVRTLSQWQNNGDLTGVRDAAALAKQPAEDQKACTQLWADVAELLKKAEQPANNAARLRFAQRAYNRKQFATATHLFTEALSAEPKLGNDPRKGHRYIAACAAAMSADGQGHDKQPLDPASEAKLRDQALGWLKSELTAWDKLVKSGFPQDRVTAMEVLAEWQHESDLSGVRDASALTKLPAEERAALTEFWSEVAKTIKAANIKFSADLMKQLPQARQALPKESPQLAGVLAQIGLGLLEANQGAQAEPLLRECLAIREKTLPDLWVTFNTKSMLGGALLGQKKYAHAEPLLLQGYQGMKEREKTIPTLGMDRLPEAVDRLVQLYTEIAKKDELAKWQAELQTLKRSAKRSK